MVTLSKKTRLLAACCHLSGLISLPIFFNGFIFPLLPLLILPPLLTWLFTRNIHDFVDRSGKKVLNYHFSILLYSICFLLIMGVSFGIAMLLAVPGLQTIGTSQAPSVDTSDGFNFFGSIFLGLWWVVSNPQCLALIHVINISIAVFFTLRGKVFSYLLAIPFFRNPST